MCNILPPKCCGAKLYHELSGAEINSWATGPSVIAAHGHLDTVSGFRESSYRWLLEAGRETCCSSEFALKHPLQPPQETRDGARQTGAGPDRRSDLVLLTLTVLGKIFAVPKHLQARESEEIPGKRDEATHTKFPP